MDHKTELATARAELATFIMVIVSQEEMARLVLYTSNGIDAEECYRCSEPEVYFAHASFIICLSSIERLFFNLRVLQFSSIRFSPLISISIIISLGTIRYSQEAQHSL